MKTLLLFLFLWLAICPRELAAQTSTNSLWNTFSNCVISESRSNVLVGFRSPLISGRANYDAGALVFPADAPIAFGFGTTLDVPLDVIALKKEFGYVISASSADGLKVEKTRQGLKYGSKIADCKGWEEKQFDKSNGQGNLRGAPYVSVARISAINYSRQLPSPEELFNFEKPGKYFVSIEVQCLAGPYSASNPTNVCVIRFPPVILQVIKHERD